MAQESLNSRPGSSILYIPNGSHESKGIPNERYVKEYYKWHLVLQPEAERQRRGLAAGLLIAKRAIIYVSDLKPDEWADLANVFHNADAPKELCKKAGVTFTGDFTAPPFNNGELAGQTKAQVHGHIYPVIEEELPPPGVHNGVGRWVEAHRANITY